MNSQTNFKQIEQEDSKAVVSFDNGTTFKVSNFMEKLNVFFTNSVLYKLSELLGQDGLGTPPAYKGRWNNSVDAEILEPESGKWKKGKMRIRVILEFFPDEPEEINNDMLQKDSNLLDDIRQNISK